MKRRSRRQKIPPMSGQAMYALPTLAPIVDGCSVIAAGDQYGLLASVATSACLATYLENRSKLFKALSAPVTAMLITVIATNVGILPSTGSPFIASIQTFVVKLATPLLLLSADMRRIIRETGPMLRAFALGSIGSLLGSLLGCKLLKEQLQTIGAPGDWKIVAALLGKNIGGGLNYMAVADILGVSDKTKALGLAVDNLLGLLYFPLISCIGSFYESSRMSAGPIDSHVNSRKSVHVVVTKEVKIENQQKFLSMADELAKKTWEEKGCVLYSFVKKVNDDSGNKFDIIEEWESMEDLEAHFQSEHFKRLVPLMDKISDTISIDICDNALSVHRDRLDTKGSKHIDGNNIAFTADDLISAITVACVITALSEAIGKLMSLPSLPISSLLSIISATAFPKVFSRLVPAGEVLGKVLLMFFFGSIGNSMGLISTALSTRGILSLLYFGLILYAVHLFVIIGVGKNVLHIDMPDILLASNANIGNHATASSLAVNKGWGQRVLPAVLVGTLGNAIGTFCGVFFGSNFV